MHPPVPDYLQPPPSAESFAADGLGLDPISIISVAGSIGDTLHFLQYPKDKERKRNADALLSRAAGGDVVAESQLRLASGTGSREDIAIMRAAGLDPGCDDPSQCGWATTWARTYIKRLLAELYARRAAGVIGTELIGQSTIPNVIGATVTKAATNPWVWLAVGAGVFLLLRRRRGR